MTTKWYGTVATNETDQDGDRFSTEALDQLALTAPHMPITYGFEGPVIGHVVSTALHQNRVEARFEGELREGYYVVPQFTYDPRTETTEPDGTRVFHKIKLMGFGLTKDPADSHLRPLAQE